MNNEGSESERISVKEKVGYGLGDTASNFYWKLFENFQLIFYTDVFGISAAAAGTMFFVTKLWDAINDPLIGFLADRTKTAWGRFRPYLIWMSIPFAITGMLTFYTPDLSDGGKLIYAYITYTLVFMAYTAINIPYGALMGVISSSSLERTSVATYRFILAFCGGLVVQLFTEPLIDFFGASTQLIDGVETAVVDKQTGFFWAVACYAIAAVFLFLVTFATTKERVVPEKKENNSFAQDLADLVKNKAWIILLFAGLFQILAGWTRGSAVGYYFTYYVDGQFGTFLAIGTVAGIIGMTLTKFWSSIFGKKLLMILANVGMALVTACFFFVGKDQIFLMYTLNALAAFIGGPIPILLWAMYADAADYSEWKTHRRATGLVFSAATFSQKMGGALGAAIPGWALGYYSFQAPIAGVQQTQSDATIAGIILMMSLIPAFFMIVGASVFLFYNLNEDFLKRIESDLLARKASDSSNSIK